MGRQKIAIKRIKDERIRQVTYYKRKRGLLKKAMELSLLCGIDVFLSIVDRNSKVMIYSSHDKIKKFVNKHFTNPEKAREVFLNRDYEDIFIKRTHLCQFKNMKKKKLSENLEAESISHDDNLSLNDHFSVSSSDDDNQIKSKIIKNQREIIKDNKAKSKRKISKISEEIDETKKKKNNKKNLLDENLPTIYPQGDKLVSQNSSKNKNISLDLIKINSGIDINKTETLFSKKNSSESIFKKFIVEKRLINNPEINKPISFNDEFKKNKRDENSYTFDNLKSENNTIYKKDDSDRKSKIDSDGISKLKNKLSLKVKIPEEKTEKNLVDGLDSNNNNNDSNFNVDEQINENISVLNLPQGQDNQSRKSNEILKLIQNENNRNANNSNLYNGSEKLNESADINKNLKFNNTSGIKNLNHINNRINLNEYNPILPIPQSNNEYLLNQNYFPFNNDFNHNQNNYLLLNDPILSARKRLREEYSNFSPLYSANLKAFTPLLSVNSPGVPGYFIFNNGGQSITTTPLPYKIQNNVMLTSFFQPQTTNQNLNFNINQSNSHKLVKNKNDDKDDNSTVKDITLHDSSNSLENNNIKNDFRHKSNNLEDENIKGKNIKNLNGNNINNNIFMKKNPQNYIFVPSPLPVNNNFYGWIMNNPAGINNAGNGINNNFVMNENKDYLANDDNNKVINDSYDLNNYKLIRNKTEKRNKNKKSVRKTK